MSSFEENQEIQQPATEDVDLKDTVSVEELEGTKRAVETDLNEQLMKEAPGGQHATMDDRARMKHYMLTRNRQINDWMQSNFTEADVLLRNTMESLRDFYQNLIDTLTVEEFKEHPITKALKGDAVILEWKAGGINLVDVELAFNPTTGFPTIKKQTDVFGKSISFKHPKLAALLVQAGVNLNVNFPRDPVTNTKSVANVKSIIFSIGQMVEIFNTRPATIIKFKTAPSTEIALKPLDVYHTVEPTGFNGMLKFMAERKFAAMSRRDWFEWNRDKSKDEEVKITDSNPALQQDVVGAASDDLPW